MDVNVRCALLVNTSNYREVLLQVFLDVESSGI